MAQLTLALVVCSFTFSTARAVELLPIEDETKSFSEDESKDLSVSATCTLTRMTWDDVKKEKVFVEYAPETAKNVQIPIQKIVSGSVKMTSIKFSAMTPEGAMNFATSISAIDMFDKSATITSALSVEIKEKDLNIRDAKSFPGDLRYNDPNLKLNPMTVSGVSFSTLGNSNGTYSVAYHAGCKLTVE